MEKKTKVLEVAKYIIENSAPIKKTAEHFAMSTSSIKKYINNDLKNIDEDVYNRVKLVQSNLEEIGRMVGGMNGKREPKYTEFEALEMAETMIANSMTLDEASAYFNVPRSSIYDKVTSLKDEKIREELTSLFEENKKRS